MLGGGEKKEGKKEEKQAEWQVGAFQKGMGFCHSLAKGKQKAIFDQS